MYSIKSVSCAVVSVRRKENGCSFMLMQRQQMKAHSQIDGSKWQIFPYTIQHCFNSQAHHIHFSTESSPISSTSHCLTLYAYCYALLILVGYRHPSAMPITCHLFHTTFHSHMIVYVSAHDCMPVCLQTTETKLNFIKHT